MLAVAHRTPRNRGANVGAGQARGARALFPLASSAGRSNSGLDNGSRTAMHEINGCVRVCARVSRVHVEQRMETETTRGFPFSTDTAATPTPSAQTCRFLSLRYR